MMHDDNEHGDEPVVATRSGGIWLRDLPDVLRRAGLNVSTWPGWENRARSSGGYDSIMAIGIHHDAFRTGTPLEQRCRYAWEGSDTRPIGAMWLHTDGRVMVGAAGATNTQGNGGPLRVSRGTIPQNAGNRHMISIEASNNGVGEPWPTVMQDAYVAMCAALCDAYGLDRSRDVIAHFEWTTRKIDPAGPSRWATGTRSWNMQAFRAEVVAHGGSTPQPPNTSRRIDMYNVLVRPSASAPSSVVLRVDATQIWHVTNGIAADIDRVFGVPAGDVSVDQLVNMLQDRRTSQPSPFSGPWANAQLDQAWNAARV
jgi:N-acetylmuramoyl-L-alanine amidase